MIDKTKWLPSDSSTSFVAQYNYQDEDMLPQDHGYPRLTHEVQSPELLHVTENNPEGDTMHGYASHSHLSPLKVSAHRSRDGWGPHAP